MLLRLRDLGDYEAALLMKAKIEACLTAVVTEEGDEALTGAAAGLLRDAQGRTVESFEPGMILYRRGMGSVEVVNPFVQPLVEPLIQANRWYLFSDPLSAPVYVYGYLNGAEGPQVTTGPVSGVDGVEVSVIFDFGVGAIDWRGAWFNPGT